MLLVTTAFEGLARNQARVLGLPQMPLTVLPHPVAGIPLAAVLEKLDAVIDDLLTRLVTPLGEAAVAARAGATLEAVEIEAGDGWADLQAQFALRGWSDGLPLVPPTPERVAAMVAGYGGDAAQVLGHMPPAMGVVSVGHVAVNAVMAGCRPGHLPLLVAAVQAMLAPEFNLKAIQATTHPVAPLMIVSGPMAAAWNLHAGSGLFGPGPWANGAVGRAIRLMLINIGGGQPVEIDKATLGQPAKFGYCIAENEAASPWAPLRVALGFAAGDTTVTLLDAEGPVNINEHEGTTAGGLLTTICGSIATTGQNNVYYAGQPLLVLSPEHAATIAAGGLSRADVQQAVYEDARIALAAFSQANIERRLTRFLAARYKDRPLGTRVSVAQCPEDVLVMVAGGAGKHSMYVPTCAVARAVTRVVCAADGRPCQPAAGAG